MTVFIIPPNNHFFNYAFKNIAVKFVKYIVLLQCFSKLCNASFHSVFRFGCCLQITLLFLKLLNLTGQFKIFAFSKKLEGNEEHPA